LFLGYKIITFVPFTLKNPFATAAPVSPEVATKTVFVLTSFLLKYPKQQQKQKIQSVVELIDLFPTLCELSNLVTPSHVQGKSLVKINQENPKNSVGFSSYHKGTTKTTSDYAYTQWFNPKKNKVIGDMLFDLNSDAQENSSLSQDSSYTTLINHFKSKIDSLKKINL
jgi:arylsulfatase A-like enzyme